MSVGSDKAKERSIYDHRLASIRGSNAINSSTAGLAVSGLLTIYVVHARFDLCFGLILLVTISALEFGFLPFRESPP